MNFSLGLGGVPFKLAVADCLVYLFIYVCDYQILFQGKVIKFHIKSRCHAFADILSISSSSSIIDFMFISFFNSFYDDEFCIC